MDSMRSFIRSFMFMSLLAVGPVLLAQQPANSPKGMPEPRNTGNVAEDEKAYLAEKTRWIQENPEEYRKMGGDVESVIASTAPKEDPAKNAFTEGPAFAVQSTFILLESKVVLVAGGKASPTEIANEQSAVENNLPIGAAKLQKGASGAIRLYVPGDFDMRATEVIAADRSVE